LYGKSLGAYECDGQSSGTNGSCPQTPATKSNILQGCETTYTTDAYMTPRERHVG